MSTIKDIAKEAGVGLGTVSRVINGGKLVKPETREKVEAVIKLLHYTPNQTARRLVQKQEKSNLIGVITPYLTHAFYYEIMKGIQKFILSNDMNMALFIKGVHPEEAIKNALKEDLAGLLIISDSLEEDEEKKVEIRRLPYVYLDYHKEGQSSISIDNYKGGESAGEYLKENGCRKIAYIGDENFSQQQKERYAGFKESLEPGKIQPLCYYSDYDGEGVYDFVKRSYEEEGYDGFFFFSDTYLYKALPYFNSLNNPPLFLGYDDLESSQYLGVSSITQQAEEVGFQGASLLFNKIKEEGTLSNQVVSPKLIVRQMK